MDAEIRVRHIVEPFPNLVLIRCGGMHAIRGEPDVGMFCGCGAGMAAQVGAAAADGPTAVQYRPGDRKDAVAFAGEGERVCE